MTWVFNPLAPLDQQPRREVRGEIEVAPSDGEDRIDDLGPADDERPLAVLALDHAVAGLSAEQPEGSALLEILVDHQHRRAIRVLSGFDHSP